jgi:hypothetical protein
VPAFDFDSARDDPASTFADPEALEQHGGLSRAQKIALLRRWEYDERELAVAVEEGMRENGPLYLRRILLALARLGADNDPDGNPPTKQGGGA